MEDKFDSLIVNLKILGKIPRNGRIRRLKGKVSLEEDHLLVPIKRFIYNDSRDQAVVDITSIIYDSFTELRHLMCHIHHPLHIQDQESKNNIRKLEMLISDLENCIPGLENLKNTYKSDPQVTAHIDLMTSKIHSHIQSTKGNLPVEEQYYSPV